MIVDNVVPNIERSENFKESKFGIRSQADLVHIFSVLRNKMYSDKILAVLREYSTNAFDAHVLVGKNTTPIEVDLPTAISPTLHIRDFGPGLSEEDIRDTYCMYGASTKRQSNDFNGQLGFGSKAAFSYTDSYTITSFQNGKKTVYEAFIDESNLGAVSKLMEIATDEPDGIKISVPVKKIDIPTFEIKAKSLYRFFEVKPKFIGRQDFIKEYTYDFFGSGWAIIKRNAGLYSDTDSVCVMGNVAYPLNLDLVFGDSLSWEEKSTFSKNTVLFFNIGELSIAASREALEYDTKTKASIAKKISVIKTEIQSVFQKEFESIDSIIAFKQKLRASRHVINSFGINLLFNGKVISDDNISLPNMGTNGKITCNYSRRRIERSSTTLGVRISTKLVPNYVSCDAVFIEKDVDDKVDRRLATLFQTLQIKNHAILLAFGTKEDKQVFLEHSYLSDSELHKLSAYAPKQMPKVVKSPTLSTDSLLYKRKDFGKDYRTKSTYWEPIDNLPQDPIFVAIDRFCPLLNPNLSSSEDNWIHPADLDSFISKFQAIMGYSISDRIVALKIKNFKELKPAPKDIFSFMADELAKKLDTLKPSLTKDDINILIKQAISTNSFSELNELFNLDLKLVNAEDAALFAKIKSVKDNTHQVKDINLKIKECESLISKLGKDTDKLPNNLSKIKDVFVEEVTAFFNRHPLLKYITIDYYNKNNFKLLASDIEKYINS